MRKNGVRIFTVVAMLFALLLSNFGTFLFFYFSDSLNRAEMQSRIRSEGSLLTLTIPLSEMGDAKLFSGDDNEITYKGHLYDVVKKETTKNGVVFYCENDSREEALNAMLDKDMKALFDHSAPGKAQSKVSFDRTQEYISAADADFNTVPRSSSFLQDSYRASAYDDVYCDIFSPPPASV